MIKNNKNVIRKEKEKNKTDNQIKKTKSKYKLNIEKTSILFNKPETSCLKPTKTFVESKKKLIKKITIHNSISSRNEIKNKNSPNVNRNTKNNQNFKNNNTNYSKCISSNIILSSRNSLSKDKKNKNFKKNNSNFNKRNICKLNDIFKKNFLKQTIIIDDEGNNNLNLNLEHTENNDYKNILGDKNLINFNENNENCNSTIFSENNETNSLFESSVNYSNNILNKINKQKDLKQTIYEKNTEEKRIKEYNKIFNLLNTNIEQFKKMFINNINKNKNEKLNYDKKIIIQNKNNFKTSTIPTGRISKTKHKIIDYNEKNDHLNLKKNLSEENIKYNKNNNSNLLYIDIKDNECNNNDYNNCINIKQDNNELKNNNLSFLESSIDNDFYQSLINQTFLQNISLISFDIDNNISNKENIINNFNNKENINKNIINTNKENIINNNLDKEETQNKMIDLLLNNKNIENDNKNKYQNYIKYLDKNNCIVF